MNDLDHAIMGTQEGEPGGQSAFEALSVLVAIREWANTWIDSQTAIVTRSDSIAALGAMAKGGSTAAATNAVARELALDVASGNYSPEIFGHIPGHLNHIADALSRLCAPKGEHKEIPQELSHLTVQIPADRTPAWWRASGPPACSWQEPAGT